MRARGRAPSAEEIAAEERQARFAPDRKQRRINSKLLKSFFRFTRWGEKRGVPFRKTMGPWEYAQKLEIVAGDVEPGCMEIAGMFEEMMFSNHSIEEKYRTQFHDRVRQLIKKK